MRDVVHQIHGLSDLEDLSEAGLEEKLTFWHSLGPLDEENCSGDWSCTSMNSPEVKEKRGLVISLIEKGDGFCGIRCCGNIRV